AAAAGLALLVRGRPAAGIAGPRYAVAVALQLGLGPPRIHALDGLCAGGGSGGGGADGLVPAHWLLVSGGRVLCRDGLARTARHGDVWGQRRRPVVAGQ